MGNPCNIQENNQAYNDGLEAFRNAYNATGDVRKSLQYAVNKVQEKYPNFNFDTNSFTDPLVKTLKEKGVVSKSFTFEKKETKKKEASEEKLVKSMAERVKKLNAEGKKRFEDLLFEKISKKGLLTNEDIKNAYAEAAGLPAMTDKFNELISNTAQSQKDLDSSIAEINEIVNQINQTVAQNKANNVQGLNSAGLTQAQAQQFQNQFNTAFQNYQNAYNSNVTNTVAFSNAIAKERGYLHQFGDFVTLNMMGVGSLLKNITGMASDSIFRALSSIASSPISSVLMRKNLIGSRLIGALKSDAFSKTLKTLKLGSPFITKTGLAQPNYISAVEAFRKIIDAQGTKDKALKTISFLLKIHPDIISRGLTTPDFFVRHSVEQSELYRIGKEKGFSGVALDAFVLNPDELSMERAKKKGQEVTFQTENWLDKILSKPFQSRLIEKSLIEKGTNPIIAREIDGLAYVVKSLVFPFVKVPANMFGVAAKMLLPEYNLARGMFKYWNKINEYKNATDTQTKEALNNEAKTIFSETIGDTVASAWIRVTALQMVAQGLISAGYQDDEEKDAREKVAGGANKININAFIRGIFGGEVKKQKGDKWVDLSSLGALGITLGAYAHTYNGYDKEMRDNMTKYMNGANFATMPFNLALNELSATMDAPFLSGYNQIVDVFKDKEGKKAEKYLMNQVMTLVGGFIPATYQNVSKAGIPEIKQTYDNEKTFSQNLFDVFQYRVAFGGEDLKNRYRKLTTSEREAVKKKEYHFFDNVLGRFIYANDPLKITETETISDYEKTVLERLKSPLLKSGFKPLTQKNIDKIKESGETPVTRLWEYSRTLPDKDRASLFPTVPKNEVNIGTTKKPVYVKLNEEQYGYFQSQASMFRMLYATPYVMSKNFDDDTFETKKKYLQEQYSKGLNEAKKNLKEKYKDLKKQKIEKKKQVEKVGSLEY